jgi:hypothetical protein
MNNDKLFDLACKAGLVHDINCGYWIYNGEPINTELKIFADMIINECINIIEPDDHPVDEINNRYAIISDINKHFGRG